MLETLKSAFCVCKLGGSLVKRFLFCCFFFSDLLLFVKKMPVMPWCTCITNRFFNSQANPKTRRDAYEFGLSSSMLYLFRSSSRSRSFSRSVSPRTPQQRSPVRVAKPPPRSRRNVDSRREREREKPDRSRERERDRPRFVKFLVLG